MVLMPASKKDEHAAFAPTEEKEAGIASSKTCVRKAGTSLSW